MWAAAFSARLNQTLGSPSLNNLHRLAYEIPVSDFKFELEQNNCDYRGEEKDF